MKKQVFMILFVALFFASIVSAQTIDWTADNITIRTERQLRDLGEYLSSGVSFGGRTITLGNDITLTSAWVPIGTSARPFNRLFDGNGHSISNLSISGTFSAAGLFGHVSGGQIRNLVVNVSEIRVDDINNIMAQTVSVGGLAGTYNSTRPVENVIVNIKDSIHFSRAGIAFVGIGGLVGIGDSLTIINSSTNGKISSSEAIPMTTLPNTYVGGLIGSSRNININNSHSTADVSLSTAALGFYAHSNGAAGGLVGRLRQGSATIDNSWASGDIRAPMNIGGLVGEVLNNNGVIKNSYATGNVSGGLRGFAGGLVGSNGTRSTENTGVNIANSYATGTVIVDSSHVGGLVGFNRGATISGSHATGTVRGARSIGGLVGYASSESVITLSYATGNIVGTIGIGGLVGSNEGIIERSYATGNANGRSNVGGLAGTSSGKIENSFATGNATATGITTGPVVNHVDGVVGGLAGSTSAVINSYSLGSVTTERGDWIGKLSGSGSSVYTVRNSYASQQSGGRGFVAGVTSLICPNSGIRTEAQMRQQGTFNTWDFSSIWAIDPNINNGFPHLRGVGIGAGSGGGGGGETGTAPDLADGTHQWERDVDSFGSSVNFNVATRNVSFTLNRVADFQHPTNPALSRWSWAGITSYPYANWNNFTGIEITYTSNRDLLVVICDPELTDLGATFRAVIPAGTNRNITLNLSEFRQPDWVQWEASIRKTLDRSKITGIGITAVDGGATTTGAISRLVLNGVVMNSGSSSIRIPQNTDNRFGILLENAVVSNVAKISVKTPEQATINLRIFDNLGNVVFSADNVRAGLKPAPTADGAIVWNLQNFNGRLVANGAYLIIAEATTISGRRYLYSARIGVNR
ncbi:MAG: hypothetical protein FWE23_02815 [Chitinivibrionia bacterium]|nr:hypothetical protein [Chitinivibrionia bacterium]